MIGMEFLKGQGFGNQLFCYVSTRCIALDNHCAFGTANQAQFANTLHNSEGSYFMDVDLGEAISNPEEYRRYDEEEKRILLNTSDHDRINGCYVAGADPKLLSEVEDNTLIYGNLQDERYFLHHKEEIKSWLHIRKEFDDYRFCDDNLCLMNIRGGEYSTSRILYLRKKYWTDAMQCMRNINPNMHFLIITDDERAARIMFPEIESHHLGMGEDYIAIKNAKYVIASNSSFAFFPIFTSDTLEYVIGPKYWARHNVSNGYWASEQNIYSGWQYLDRNGDLFSADECRKELEVYKKVHENCGDKTTGNLPGDYDGKPKAYYDVTNLLHVVNVRLYEKLYDMRYREKCS